MRLPKNLLNMGTYTKPRIFLCEVDKTKIAELEVIDLKGSFKFNSISEITFEVPRVYNDIITGKTIVNPHYHRIEALRLIYLENFGYFELQGPELVSDGIKESKSCSAYSFEYTLSQKYLDNFYVNTGGVDSVEVMYAGDGGKILPVTLYNPSNPKLSLLHCILEKVYGWKIGHVDYQLQTLSRQFEIDRESVYDFIINEICEKFNCYAVFDTVNNTINLYAESPTSRFIGDGVTKTFKIGSEYADEPLFSSVEIVSINGYKTTRWTYSIADNIGILTLEEAPEQNADIEIVGVDSTWETNVFITFDNLAQEVNVNYDSDNIKTVLTVTYGDDYDIRETNLGLPYLTDLSYYYTVDWMGQDLYDAYTTYLEKSNNSQYEYTKNSKEILKINDHIYYEENRLSLEYSLVQSVHEKTVGTYYVRTENSDGSFYYTEVSLPSEYKAGTDYYSNVTTNLNEQKVSDLYSILKSYFYACYNNQSDKMNDALNELKGLSDSFKFMENYSIEYLHDGLKSATSEASREAVLYNFLGEMWQEVGRTPLKLLYLAPYENTKNTNATAGWSQKSNANYGYYYTAVLFSNSITNIISKDCAHVKNLTDEQILKGKCPICGEYISRDTIIKTYEKQRAVYQNNNKAISDSLLMINNFTEKQLIRLNAFLREDELHLDDIIQTSTDNLSSSFKIKQDAMESGRIELQKRCKPQLQFNMDMANIYAIPEFAPIIDHFQLGRIIRVGIRRDFIKQSRLLQIDINFEDLSDFSVEFGELTSLRTQSDIHADLLSKAISAGKSVATNSSYWTKGADAATSTDLKIQQGLLDALTQIKATDGTQGIVIDKYGIKLQKILDDGSIDPHQVWMVNNQILFSDDGFKTSRSALGEVTVDGHTYYGLITELVLSGYIEGSKIVGGEIMIGEQPDGSYAFRVWPDGTVTMGGGSSIGGYTASDFDNMNNSITNTQDQIKENTNTVQNIQGQVENINAQKMYRIEVTCSGPQLMNFQGQSATLSCHVYSWDAEITNEIDPSAFQWIRTSSDADEDYKWNNDARHKGTRTLIVTTQDIKHNASFSCKVDIP